MGGLMQWFYRPDVAPRPDVWHPSHTLVFEPSNHKLTHEQAQLDMIPFSCISMHNHLIYSLTFLPYRINFQVTQEPSLWLRSHWIEGSCNPFLTISDFYTLQDTCHIFAVSQGGSDHQGVPGGLSFLIQPAQIPSKLNSLIKEMVTEHC